MGLTKMIFDYVMPMLIILVFMFFSPDSKKVGQSQNWGKGHKLYLFSINPVIMDERVNLWAATEGGPYRKIVVKEIE